MRQIGIRIYPKELANVYRYKKLKAFRIFHMYILKPYVLLNVRINSFILSNDIVLLLGVGNYDKKENGGFKNKTSIT